MGFYRNILPSCIINLTLTDILTIILVILRQINSENIPPEYIQLSGQFFLNLLYLLIKHSSIFSETE